MSERKDFPNAGYQIKVKDLIRVLGAAIKFLETTSGKEDRMVIYLKELTRILNSFKSLTGNELIDLLIDKKRKEAAEPTDITRFDSLSLSELRNVLTKNSLKKDALLLIAERRFNLSRGTLMKMKKELIKSHIENAIRNIETLDAIKRKASE